MDDATGEANGTGLRVTFDRRLKLELDGASVSSDAGLLAFREFDDALGGYEDVNDTDRRPVGYSAAARKPWRRTPAQGPRRQRPMR